MRLWLDDVRDVPYSYDIGVRSAKVAIELIKTGVVTEVSLDHDLGDDNETGQAVADFIEFAAHAGVKRIKWNVHTDNGSARPRMEAALKSADRYWDKHEKKT